MAYKLIDIEGVGAAYAEKLAAAGLVTTVQYLEKCATPAGRKALAEEIPGINAIIYYYNIYYTSFLRFRQ